MKKKHQCFFLGIKTHQINIFCFFLILHYGCGADTQSNLESDTKNESISNYSKPISSTKILGPRTSPIDKSVLPFIGHLKQGFDSSTAICTASLIAPYVLLTAAHCVTRFSPNSQRVQEIFDLPNLIFSKEAVAIPNSQNRSIAARAYVHPLVTRYTPNEWANYLPAVKFASIDIAVIAVTDPTDFKFYFDLGGDYPEAYDGDPAIICGYGNNNNGSNSIKIAGNTSFIHDDSGYNIYHLSDGQNDSYASYGDSGGPIILDSVSANAATILSLIGGSGSVQASGAFGTDAVGPAIKSFKDWLDQTIPKAQRYGYSIFKLANK